MKLNLIIMLSVFLFSSCSSTIFVKNNKTSFNQLNSELNNETVSIVINDGQEIIGVQVKISNKTIDWLDPKTNKWQFASISNVNKIFITNNSSGALQGLGFGALAGIFIGSITEESSENKNTSNSIGSNAGKGIGEAIGFTVSCFSGLAIGAMIGATDKYIFNDSQKLNDKNGNLEREIYTIEIKSIIKKTTQYITVLWKHKAIRLPRLKIINLINKENKTFIKISKETYMAYFE